MNNFFTPTLIAGTGITLTKTVLEGYDSCKSKDHTTFECELSVVFKACVGFAIMAGLIYLGGGTTSTKESGTTLVE